MWKGYEFKRLDGSTNRVKRSVDIRLFNQKESPIFAFLVSSVLLSFYNLRLFSFARSQSERIADLRVPGECGCFSFRRV
jgi:hypothetical protein